MPLALSRYVNLPVFVSIPALFDDGVARSFTLLGAESNGLWLQSDQLTDRLLGDDGRDLAAMAPAVFVPFAQIAGVLVATTLPEQRLEPPLIAAAAKPRASRRASAKSAK